MKVNTNNPVHNRPMLRYLYHWYTCLYMTLPTTITGTGLEDLARTIKGYDIYFNE
jgi:hypothetical protein